jgi:hypothetical protein
MVLIIANKAIEQIILNGQLRSYGLEYASQKRRRLNGWISTLYQNQSNKLLEEPEESGINGGNWYNSTYDKLHNVAVTSSYNLNEKWSLD